jgi:hypothetical protein
MTTGTADKFIGGKLYAIVPISLMTAPSGKYLRTIKVNDYVGTIHSWVLNNGIVWSKLDNDFGEHIGFVQHDKGKFDTQKLENSIAQLEAKRQREIQEAVDKRVNNNSSFGFFNEFEGLFKTIMIVIVLLTILNFTKK